MDRTSIVFRPTASTARLPQPNGALPGWCAIAQPIVRSVSFHVGRRYWLQPCERQDLEQELWLELLVRHGGTDRVDDFRSLSGKDARQHRAAVWLQLGIEVDRIAAALVRCWPFWRRLRPAPERQMSDAVTESLAAVGRDGDRHQLSVDVTALLAALPEADRQLCDSLMAGAPFSAFDQADFTRRVAALRADFTALDLHDYR